MENLKLACKVCKSFLIFFNALEIENCLFEQKINGKNIKYLVLDVNLKILLCIPLFVG